MGSRARKPRLDSATDVNKFGQELMTFGLPAELEKQLRERGTSGIFKAFSKGANELKTRLRNAPVSALTQGISDLTEGSSSALGDLELGIGDRDFNARLQGSQTRLAAAGMNNQTELQRYGIDKQGEFNLGQFAGQLAGGAGAAAGGWASKTCFCYAEVFGNTSREFIAMRDWANNNVSETVKQGYMVLSALVIPVLRKSPMLKRMFRKLGLKCLRQTKTGGLSLEIMKVICRGLSVFSLSNSQVEHLNIIFNGR